MNEKNYIIPPDLGEKYLILGFTFFEISLIVILFFVALSATLHGVWQMLLLPTLIGVLLIRNKGQPNMLSLLIIRFNYFLGVQQYSLNPHRGYTYG